MPEQEQQLWKRTKNLERRDPLYDNYVAGIQTMQHAKKMKLLQLHKDANLYAPTSTFTLRKPDAAKAETYVAEVHIDPAEQDNEKGLYIAVSPKGGENTPELIGSYLLLPDGSLVDLDNSEGVAKGTFDFNKAQMGLESVRQSLNYSISSAETRNRYRRQDRNRVIRTVGIVAASAGIVTGAIAGGIYMWGTLPDEAADRARSLYDAQPHELEVPGAYLNTHDFDTIPKSEFKAIPDFGGSDRNLNEPRIVELDSTDGCDTINVQVPSNEKLYVALAQGSLYGSYHYNATENGDGVKICIAEDPPSDDGFPDDIPIAVQTR